MSVGGLKGKTGGGGHLVNGCLLFVLQLRPEAAVSGVNLLPDTPTGPVTVRAGGDQGARETLAAIG